MSDKVFALSTVFVGGVFSLLVALVSQWLTAARESRTLRREVRRDEVAATRLLYEETLFALDRSCRSLGKGTDEDQDQACKLLARLTLHAPDTLREQYLQTTDRVDEWAAQAQRGEPEQCNGFLKIRAGAGADKAKAQQTWPLVERDLERLKTLMREHLRDLGSDLMSRSAVVNTARAKPGSGTSEIRNWPD